MPQLDATTQGLEGLFQRGVQSVNCATGTGPGQEYHRDPFVGSRGSGGAG